MMSVAIETLLNSMIAMRRHISNVIRKMNRGIPSFYFVNFYPLQNYVARKLEKKKRFFKTDFYHKFLK